MVTSTLLDDFYYDPTNSTFVGTSSISYDVTIVGPCVGATIVEPITWYDTNVIRVPNGGSSAGLFSFEMSNPLCTSEFNGSPQFNLFYSDGSLANHLWFGPVANAQQDKWSIPVVPANAQAWFPHSRITNLELEISFPASTTVIPALKTFL